MNIRLRFPLKRPFIVADHWPLESGGAELTFETKGPEVTAFIVTFRDQPIEMAPSVARLSDGEIKAQINIAGEIEAKGRRLLRRFVDYANLYFVVDVDTDAVEAEYIPVDDAERAKIDVFGFKSTKQRPVSHLPFSLLAQAYFATESPDDPSFPARMLHLAREALLDEQYFDAFRYSFLLLESVYGDGKFKSRDLVQAFVTNTLFKRVAEQLIDELRSERTNPRSPASSLVEHHPTLETLVAHLVDRRGHYFHGNLAHPKSWHPDEQEDAKPIADFCVQVAGRVSQSYSRAMFAPEMNARAIANAKRYGAMMTIEVQFEFIDAHKMRRTERINLNVPGTKPTSQLAIQAHKGFLDWAELHLSDATLLSLVARDKGSGIEIFRSEYLRKEG